MASKIRRQKEIRLSNRTKGCKQSKEKQKNKREESSGSKTSQTLGQKIQKCHDGHHEADVYQEKVVGRDGLVIGYRYRCRCCKFTLVVSPHENLLGNSFDVIERREEVKTERVLRCLDSVFV
jgi:hypothetical protein